MELSVLLTGWYTQSLPPCSGLTYKCGGPWYYPGVAMELSVLLTGWFGGPWDVAKAVAMNVAELW